MAGICFTHEKKDIDLGPLQVWHQQKGTLPISPVVRTFSLVIGAGLVVVGVRSR